MAYDADRCSDLSKWMEELLHMDFITTEFQKKEQHNQSKCYSKKRGLEHQVHLRGGDTGTEKKKREFVLKEV